MQISFTILFCIMILIYLKLNYDKVITAHRACSAKGDNVDIRYLTTELGVYINIVK